MIVKVQRAIFPTNAPALIYDKKREVYITRHLSATEKQKLKGDFKAYFNAKYKDGKVTILDRVIDQPW